MNRTLAILAALALSASAFSSADAAACRDAKGKFMKCPPVAAVATSAKKAPCKDAKGKFMKCAAATATTTSATTTTAPKK